MALTGSANDFTSWHARQGTPRSILWRECRRSDSRLSQTWQAQDPGSLSVFPHLRAASSDHCRSRVIGVALYLHKAGIQVRRPGSHTHRHTCVQRLIDADRRDDDRAAKLEWLNFSWSVGATAGPVCFLPFLRRGDTGSQFAMMLDLSLAIFAWGSSARAGTADHPCADDRRSWFLRKSTHFIAHRELAVLDRFQFHNCGTVYAKELCRVEPLFDRSHRLA
jgi:hypothetical protein